MTEVYESASDAYYVAFCDILGFASRVSNDFESTHEAYVALANSWSQQSNSEMVSVSMFSDSIILSCPDLPPLISAVRMLWFHALQKDFMIRGSIAKGKHWEKSQGRNLFVVSEALVRAVKIEQMVGVPAVVIADDVEIEDDLWIVSRFPFEGDPAPIHAELLYFRDRTLVNPFNLLWGVSAANRARLLMEQSPNHKDKYLWFLSLFEAVSNHEFLMPPDVSARLLAKGDLVKLGEGG